MTWYTNKGAHLKEEEKKDPTYSRTTRRLNQVFESRLKRTNKTSNQDRNEEEVEVSEFSQPNLKRNIAISHRTVPGFFKSRQSHLSENHLDPIQTDSEDNEQELKVSEGPHPLDQYIASSGEFSNSFETYLSSLKSDGDESDTQSLKALKISDLEDDMVSLTNSDFLGLSSVSSNQEDIEGNYNEVDASESVSRSVFLIPNSVYYIQLLVVAFLGSLTFYSFPLIHRVATGTAVNNLYAAFAMNHSISPYIQLFGSAGPLYYLLNQVGNINGSTWILWLIEVLMVWLSAVSLFKIFDNLLYSKRLSSVISASVTFMLAGLSLGGAQPILFAMPFALYGFRVLNRYFMDDEAAKDEVILLYGAAGAIASLFFPIFLLLFVLGVLGLIGSNISRGNWGRGFYQLLCGLMGAVLVYAVVGYYTLTSQIFFPVIEQAVTLPFTHLNLSLNGLMNLGISLVIVLLSGLLSSWLLGFYYVSNGHHRIWSVFLLIAGFLSLVLISFQKEYSPANAFVILPFVVMFIGLTIDRKAYQEKIEEFSLVASLSQYLKATSFFPIVALLLIVAFPFVNNTINADKINSEKVISSYIDRNTSIKDQVILVADNNNIDYLAQRVSAVTMPPSYYPVSYSQTYDINLASSKAKYVVVQNSKKLSDSVKSTLKTSYTEVNLKDTNFTVYKLK